MKVFFSFLVKTAICLLPLLLVCSCESKQPSVSVKDEIHLTLEPQRLPSIAKLSEIAVGVRLVPLQTDTSCFMGSTNMVYVGRKSMIISTVGDMSELFHFTPDGRFLNKIGKQGKGPGEYTEISSMTVMEATSSVYLRGWSMRRILEYSVGGKLIREINAGIGSRGTMVLEPARIAFNSSKDYEVQIVDLKAGDTLKYIKTNPATASGLPRFSGSREMGFYYSALGRDTIWRIDPDSMRPLFVCNFGSGHFTTNDYFKSMHDPNGYPAGKLSIGGGIIYGSGYYGFSLLRQNDQKEYTYAHVMIDEKTKNAWHLEQGPESDDILFCTSTDFRTVSASGEWVSVVGAEELIEALPQIRENKNFKYPPELIGQIEKMTIEDNPVLVFYSFR